MALAAQLTPGELVLEPSAGTGLLAIHAEIAGAELALNELAETRHGLLRAFSRKRRSRLQRRADRRLSRRRDPAHGRADEPALFGLARHRAQPCATNRAAYPFRACAVCRTADGLCPDRSEPRSGRRGDRRALCRPFGAGVLRFHRERRRRIYPATAPASIPGSRDRPEPGPPRLSRPVMRQPRRAARADRGGLPPRPPLLPFRPSGDCAATPVVSARQPDRKPVLPFRPLAPRERRGEVRYEAREAAADTKFSDRLYEPYEVQTIAIAGAKPHPTKLVQSAAMASVRPPMPSYLPLLPKRLVDGRHPVRCADRDHHLCRRSPSEIAGRPLQGRRKLRQSDRLPKTATKARCSSARAISLATARAAARAARPRASCSTTGCKDAARPSGSPNPTS